MKYIYFIIITYNFRNYNPKIMKTVKKSLNSSKLHACLLALSAILAGGVNGFLGTGGGIVLMFALSALPENEALAPKDRFATLIAVILPLSLISLASYMDKLDTAMLSPYLLPGIFGGFAGALLLDKLDVKIVKRLFALMVIWAGYNFLK